MTKIGELYAEGAGGDVLKTEQGFVFHYRGVRIDSEDNEEFFTGKSEIFPTLDALRKHFRGFFYKPLNGQFDFSELNDVFSNSSAEFKRLCEIEESRRRDEMN